VKKIVEKLKSRQGAQQLVLNIPEVVKDELHELVVGAGMTVLMRMLEADRDGLCGPHYRHSATRTATRGGSTRGELSLGGRRVQVRRPRVRGVDGKEMRLATWDAFANNDPLNERAVEQMVVGVSTRKYRRSLEAVDVPTRGVSKSAVSRRFVALTKARLDAAMKASIAALDIVVLMLDGITLGDHVVLVALGVDADGKKHVLGFHEGATENTTACTALLAGLRERGLRTDRSILVVIDGAKALRKAIGDVFGRRALVQRCQVHKQRNVVEHLPEHMHASTRKALREAYGSKDAKRAQKLLENLARALDDGHPSAAASIREGLAETLTIKGFKLPDALARTLSSTNAIENIQSGIRRVCGRVTTWRSGSMVLRWVGAAVVEHARGFRRVRGHSGMTTLVSALRAIDAGASIAVATSAA
jgi:transposase-like protein